MQHRGLSHQEASERLKKYGPNILPENRWKNRLLALLKLGTDPMGLMLLALAAVYYAIGQKSDAVILALATIPILGVDVALEIRSGKALKALQKTLNPTCFVLREGEPHEISSAELVPGDILILEAGQTLAADGKILEEENLCIDESSVTGESVPVEKTVTAPFISGTTIVTGRGLGEIEKTGLASQFGTIWSVVQQFEKSSSAESRQLNRILKWLFGVAVALAIGIFCIQVLRGLPLDLCLIAALTLAMAAIPEEFPMVLTLYLSVAAWQLSKKGILVKELPAIEHLGQVDIICTDKTGTLTEGIFKLQKAIDFLPENLPEDQWMAHLLLACEPHPIDGMEIAIAQFGHNQQLLKNLQAEWQLVYDYPFETDGKHMSHVWRHRDSGEFKMVMKGAIEGVLEHCHPSLEISQKIAEIVEREAGQGRRLLGLAAKNAGAFSGNRSQDEQGATFFGIAVFSDPVRHQVSETIQSCNAAGIQVKMLTGDHLLTAHAVAEEIGLPHDHDLLVTGDELANFSQEKRHTYYEKATIFARLLPRQKHELISYLNHKGYVTAMTGDGINDAPAMRLASVGISMGKNATDVARSVAQVVLMKSNFAAILDAIRQGRATRNSLTQSFAYLIAFHTPIIALSLFSAIFAFGTILLPIHLVLLELIMHPTAAFAFIQNNGDLNSSSGNKQFLNPRKMVAATARGIILTLLSLVCYFGFGLNFVAESMAVNLILFGNIGLFLAEVIDKNASFQRRSTLVPAVILYVSVWGLNLVPQLSKIFKLGRVSIADLAVVSLVGIAIPLLFRSKWESSDSVS